MTAWRQKVKAIAWLLLVTSNAGATLSQNDWIVRLANSNSGKAAVEAPRFRLPKDMPPSVRAALIYELDGIDVTKSVTITPDDNVVLSQEALAPGVHRLRLIHAPSGGRWRELGVWSFSILDSQKDQAPLGVKQPNAVSTHIGRGFELALNFSQPAPGSAGPIGKAQSAQPHTMLGHGQYDQEAAKDITAIMRSGPLAVQLGKQKLLYRSLIHKDQKHDGTAANWTPGEATRLLGFSVHTPSQAKLHGVVVEHQWPSLEQDQLRLSGGWLSAASRATDVKHTDGSAWSLAGDASLLARRLSLRLELADSHSEESTADLGGQDEGPTYRWQSELRSSEQADLAWLLGVEQTRVAGSFFRLANPSLATDRLTLRSYGNLTSDAWRFDWSIERWRNNLVKDEQIPTKQTQKTRFATTWAPEDVFGLGLLGKPSYKFSADHRRVRELATPTVADRDLSVSHAFDLNLRTEFAHDRWLWGFNTEHGRSRDLADAATRSLALDLYGDFTALGQLSAKPSLAWRRNYGPTSNVSDEKWSAKLTSSSVALRNDLKADFTMEHMRWRPPDDARKTNETSLGGHIVWTLRRPKVDRSGLSLTLTGSYNGGNAFLRPTSDLDNYGLMLSLSSEHLVKDQ